MRNPQYVILLYVLLVGSTFCNFVTAQDSTETLIGRIRSEYKKINAASLRVVYSAAKGASSEGADVKKYYDGAILKKIVSTYYGEMGKTVSEYYFLEGQLCFLYDVNYNYDKPLSGKVKTRIENRYYFHNLELIRWIDEKGAIKDRQLYADKAAEILRDEDLK